MRKRSFGLGFILAFILASTVFSQVKRPEELTFPPLKFEPPEPRSFRHNLAQGMRAYIQEDRTLPLVNLQAIIHFGDIYVSKDKAGLGNLMAQTLIKGGTKTREGSQIEDRLDFLGASLNFSVAERTATLSLSILSKDLEEGLDLFFDVLMNPEFREDSLKIAKGRMIEQLKTANDAPSAVLSREYERLLYGEHPLTYQPTKASIEGISREDLKAYHRKYFFPRNIILAAAGDFNKKTLIARINQYVSKWRNQTASFPAIPKNFPEVEPGVYFIQKKINQGYVSIGHLGLEDTNPDYFAVQVMNFILGGGSFTSRITSKVRSDEGLAYNTGSRFTYRWGFPGTFSGYVQTKSSTVGYAISLILKEFERIRQELVTDEELETAINYYLESFSEFFSSPITTMRNFALLELQGKPLDYYKTYRDNIRRVTKEKVLEVAKKYIRPDKMVIMIVGDWEPCNQGDPKFPGPLSKLGKVNQLTLRDPLTGEPLK
ncbi:MAG: insulinase family protein [Candidatus Aminicenantes bacterium]|nr:insulinase family protein [Candidatus Aminicenantes bacterium]